MGNSNADKLKKDTKIARKSQLPNLLKSCTQGTTTRQKLLCHSANFSPQVFNYTPLQREISTNRQLISLKPIGVMLYSGTVIDWKSVIFNACWIVGCAIILSTASYSYWTKEKNKLAAQQPISTPSIERFYWLGFIFIGTGLAGTSQKAWEIVVWVLFILYAAAQTYLTSRQSN